MSYIPHRVEGDRARGDVVVHVFSDEIRAYYEIERLYRDVPKVDWRHGETDGSRPA